jgi:hypothetical protein
MMASIQLITLSITSRTGLVPLQLLILPVLAGVTYIFLGNRAFRAASQDGYQLSLAVLIVVFGLVLIAGI